MELYLGGAKEVIRVEERPMDREEPITLTRTLWDYLAVAQQLDWQELRIAVAFCMT